MLRELLRYTLVCLDGESDTAESEVSESDPGPNDGRHLDPTWLGDVQFNDDQQQQVNKILAKEKGKHKESLQKLEKKLELTLTSQNLTQKERDELQESLEDVRKQQRTKEAQLKHEKQQAVEELTSRIHELEGENKGLVELYTSSTINRGLMDAAVSGDAFNPEIVSTVLRPLTKLVDHKPMVDWPQANESGEVEELRMTPEQAVEKMKGEPQKYGGLFKKNIVSGIGGSSATDGYSSGDGKVDPRSLTTEQYMKLRKEDPARLGLNPQR